MRFEVSVRQVDLYIAFEITESPCPTPAASYGCVASGDTAVGSIPVTPNTTYYVWIGNGYSGHLLPQVDICLW